MIARCSVMEIETVLKYAAYANLFPLCATSSLSSMEYEELINISMRELFSAARFCTHYITVYLHLTVPKVQGDYANISLMSFLQNQSICILYASMMIHT